jgi:hypothetical protein
VYSAALILLSLTFSKRHIQDIMLAHAHGYHVSEPLKDVNLRKEYLKYNENDGIITMSDFVNAHVKMTD